MNIFVAIILREVNDAPLLSASYKSQKYFSIDKRLAYQSFHTTRLVDAPNATDSLAPVSLLAMEELLCLKEDCTLTLQWHLPYDSEVQSHVTFTAQLLPFVVFMGENCSSKSVYNGLGWNILPCIPYKSDPIVDIHGHYFTVLSVR